MRLFLAAELPDSKHDATHLQQVTQLRQRVSHGSNKTELAKQFGISRETLYQYLKASTGGSGKGA